MREEDTSAEPHSAVREGSRRQPCTLCRAGEAKGLGSRRGPPASGQCGRPGRPCTHTCTHSLTHSLGVFRGALPKAWFHVAGRLPAASKSPGAADGLGPGRHM